MSDVNIAVLNERVEEHGKTIVNLRKNAHDATHNFIAINETMKTVTRDIESIYNVQTLLSDKIHNFELKYQEYLVKRDIMTKIISKWPKVITHIVLMSGIIYLAFDSKSMHEFMHGVKNILN